MPTVSIITAAEKSRRDFLIEAGHSVAAQELPPGWALEWVVQEDGADPALAEAVGQFPFASHQANRQRLRAGPTRNLALARARGELLRTLDSDDLLLPDALAAAIEVFARHPEIHWVAAQADDLLPDGRRAPFATSVATGPIPAGLVSQIPAPAPPRQRPPGGADNPNRHRPGVGRLGRVAGQGGHLSARRAGRTHPRIPAADGDLALPQAPGPDLAHA